MLKTDWVAARFVVPPMSRSELREAIEEPASKRVMYFQSDDPKNPLVDQLIDEVAEMPGALPLLSFTLSELYLKYLRRQKIAQDQGDSIDRAITEADYRELGGVARSLTQRADQEYERLVQQDSAYEQTVRHVMLRMVAVSGGELARRRVPLSELKYPQEQNERVKTVIHQFSQARLLVEGTDTDGQPYVEPAHDALVRGWQKLLAWKQEHEEDLLLQRKLTPVANDWNFIKNKEKEINFLGKIEAFPIKKIQDWRRKRQARLSKSKKLSENSIGYLWNNDPRIDQLNQLLSHDDNWLNQIEAQFIEQSIIQKGRNTFRLWSTTTAVILGLVVLTGWALYENENSQIRAIIANSNALFSSGNDLDALVEAIKAGRRLKQPLGAIAASAENRNQAVLALNQAFYRVKENNRWVGSINSAQRVSFSPDEQMFAVPIGRSIQLWNRNGELLHVFSGESDINSVNFSPNSQMLVAGEQDGAINIWELGSKSKSLVSSMDHGGSIDKVSFSPNGQTIASSGSSLKIWSTDGTLIRRLQDPDEIAYDVTFGPDGQIIASTGSGIYGIRIRKIDGTILKTLSLEDVGLDSVSSISFSSDGNFIATSQTAESATEDIPGTAKIWSKNGTLISTLKGHNSGVLDVAFSPNNQLVVTASADNTIKLWSRDGQLIKTLRGHTSWVRSISFGQDGKTLVSSGDDGTVRFWNLEDVPLIIHRNGQGWPKIEGFSLDSQKVYTSEVGGLPGGSPYLVRNHNGELLETLNFDVPEENKYIDFHPDSSTIISSDKAVALSQDTQTIASLSSIEIRSANGYVKTFKISKDEAENPTNILRLWDQNGRQIKSWKIPDESISQLFFSPDDEIIASVGTNEQINYLRLWRRNGRKIASWEVSPSVDSLTFSPDGKTLASYGHDSLIQIWKLDGSLVRNIPVATNDISFSPDGNMIAASEDQTVQLWSINGTLLHTFEHNASVLSSSFSPDGKTLASSSYDQTGNIAFDSTRYSTVILWNLDVDELMKHSCHWVSDYLRNPNSGLSGSDRHICDGVPNLSRDELASDTISPLDFKVNDKGEIKFAPGTTSKEINSKLQPFDKDSYTFRASAGQRFSVYLGSNDGAFIDGASISVRDLNGNNFFSDNTWMENPVLPMNSTYTITVSNDRSDISVPYTLTLEIEP